MPTTAVLVAARDLAPGTTLTAGDLRTVRLPTSLVPPSALRPGGRATGRALAVAVPAGVPVTTAALDVGRVLPAGTVATPVRLADPGETALLTVGDRVDVLAAPTDPTNTDPTGAGSTGADAPDAGTTGPAVAGAAPTVVAADVPVLAIPTAAADSGDQGGLVVLATTAAQAAALAAAAGSERLSVTVRTA